MQIYKRIIFLIILYQFKLNFTYAYHSNEELIRHLKDSSYIRTTEVELLMLSVDRGHFIDKNPYVDAPQPIGFGVTISAPHMHAITLEEALPKLNFGARVLDVGSGSGYLTACFSKKVGSSGIVVGIDHIKELVTQSIGNANKVPGNKELIDSQHQIFVTGDGKNGYSKFAPYDVIHVGAASETIPEKLAEQLNIGGLLICPIGKQGDQFLTRITKSANGSLSVQQLMPVRYVLLTDKATQLNSEF